MYLAFGAGETKNMEAKRIASQARMSRLLQCEPHSTMELIV
jgi:hypothetical protein